MNLRSGKHTQSAVTSAVRKELFFRAEAYPFEASYAGLQAPASQGKASKNTKKVPRNPVVKTFDVGLCPDVQGFTALS
jgi:hypothetical protein